MPLLKWMEMCFNSFLVFSEFFSIQFRSNLCRWSPRLVFFLLWSRFIYQAQNNTFEPICVYVFCLLQDGAEIVESTSRGKVVSTLDPYTNGWIDLGTFQGKTYIFLWWEQPKNWIVELATIYCVNNSKLAKRYITLQLNFCFYIPHPKLQISFPDKLCAYFKNLKTTTHFSNQKQVATISDNKYMK